MLKPSSNNFHTIFQPFNDRFSAIGSVPSREIREEASTHERTKERREELRAEEDMEEGSGGNEEEMEVGDCKAALGWLGVFRRRRRRRCRRDGPGPGLGQAPLKMKGSPEYTQHVHPHGRGLSDCSIICTLMVGDYQHVQAYAPYLKGIIGKYHQTHPPGIGRIWSPDN